MAELDDRVKRLEEVIEELQKKPDAPKRKDSWDKLSALSTVLSGVIIAGIGVWVNESLNKSQQAAQTSQAEAARQIELAHNKSLEDQAKASQALQEKQFEYSKLLEIERRTSQEKQAEAALNLQREQSRATLEFQKAQADTTFKLERIRLTGELAKDAEANPNLRATNEALVGQVSPELQAIVVAERKATISSNPADRDAANKTLAQLAKSDNPEVKQAAGEALARVTYARRAQAITDILEMGRSSNYGGIRIIPGSALFFGRGIFALGAGNRQNRLYELIKSYCDRQLSRETADLCPYLGRIQSNDLSLTEDHQFLSFLQATAKDPVMVHLQDDYYDSKMWDPAQKRAAALGLKFPLSMAILYDLHFNIGASGAQRFEDSASKKLGGDPAHGVDEKKWITGLLDAVQGSRVSTFRHDALRSLVDGGNWNLDLPLEVNGVAIQD